MDKQAYYDELCNDELIVLRDLRELKKQLEAINILKARHFPSFANKLSSELFDGSIKFPPIQPEKIGKGDAKYPKANSVWKKVLIALNELNEIKEGTAKEVGDKFLELYPTYTPKAAHENAKYYLSRLSKNKTIEAIKIDGQKGHLYKIKGPLK
jgi:hypothetical protein